MGASTTARTDMAEHERLARLWCHANGGKGVADQIRAIMEQLTAEQLRTMLTTIGVKS